ncbi:MCE family protein [Actinokineospora iranica]|uniref:Phospholipid/cholesterol/gamma-HCH transport system substrate-binding protein n=1 Tax=Actinokineospora iranica TaxID=1271860 RepID=A0A1G6YS16_9PSEU|nr:MCE family protein [Actinokineospora iranica]SDD93072.1 phospholipid/cholesterol/gamma-HCH transport system substrate-binding protein [Actinokineospora iranica]
MNATRLRNRALGLVFIVILGALGWLSIAIYQKAFVTTTPVTLHTDRVGNQLKANADVKIRGVMVGTVKQVRTTGDGVAVDLAIDPDKLPLLPSNVSARLLPKTLFGQRYVSLIVPERPSRPLAAGDVIQQDTTMRAIEVEKALNDLLPVLQAVQPQKLSSSLGAIAQALEGRGKPLGETLATMNQYLDQLNPQMPQIQTDISRMADTVEVYEAAGPDIVEALDGLTVTAKTFAEQKNQVAELFKSLTSTTNDVDKFLRANHNTLISLADASRPTLEKLARYSPEFPCLTDAVIRLKPLIDKMAGVGTNEPGLHVKLTVKESRGAYVPGRDRPVFNAGGGPRCPGGGGGVAPASYQPDLGSDGLGVANSPEENQFIAELLAPVEGVSPSEMPQWSSLLVGPLLRGTEVTLS